MSERQDSTSSSQGPDAPGPSASVKERLAPSRCDVLPPFRVLLHNDDVNRIDYVIESIVDLTPLSPQQAALATREAHSTGVALLLVTHKERAELYVDQFRSKSLVVTIEPAE